jgi:Flp pilus assembly protein TadG
LRRVRADDERGAIAVIFAIVLVVMLGIGGLVVDIGFASQKARQIQNSADAAALAAAQSLPSTTNAISTAQTYAQSNLPGGSFNWSGCTDSTRPSGWTYVATSPCVSFDPSFTYVRVRMPDQSYNTMFARALGINSVGASRTATARIVGAGFGSIQPFALYTGFTAGLSCMKQGPSGHRIATCDDPTTGNFNLLDITQYGNATLSTPTRCGNSFQQARMIDNIAIGADHLFSTFATGTTPIVDGCGTAGPNTLPPRTGNDLNAFDLGIVHGTSSDTSDGGGARLTRGQYPKAPVLGRNLDNKPLWEFIPAGLSTTPGDPNAVPPSCKRETFTGLLTSTPVAQQQAVLQGALEQCFTDYEAGGWTGVVFGLTTNPFGAEVPVDLYDIQLSPRFAYVPQFWQATPPNGSSSNLNIQAFRAIYVEDLYANCSSGCQVDFSPGPWNTSAQGSSNDKAEAMTAWVFDDKMLPMSLRGDPTSVGQNNYVQLVRNSGL